MNEKPKQVSITFRKMRLIDNIVGHIYDQNPEIKNTKFGYAYNKFIEKYYAPAVKEFNEELFDIRLDNAMTDESGVVLTEKGGDRNGFKFTKEALKKVVKKERELQEKWDAKEYKIIPHISSYAPAMPQDWEEELRGVII